MSEEEYEKLIEKMARAIYAWGFSGAPWDECSDGARKEYRAKARAAAEAIGLKPGMVVVSAEEIENLRPVVVTC